MIGVVSKRRGGPDSASGNGKNEGDASKLIDAGGLDRIDLVYRGVRSHVAACAFPTLARHTGDQRGGHMALRRTSLAFAVALIAAIPVSLLAQGGAAKANAGQKNATPAAQKNASPPPAPAKSTAASASSTPSQTAAANTERAKCKDGTSYSGTSRQGACSSHGGVAEWLTASKGTVPKGATARCNDGTYYSKAERQGACSGHKGVAEWLKKG